MVYNVTETQQEAMSEFKGSYSFKESNDNPERIIIFRTNDNVEMGVKMMRLGASLMADIYGIDPETGADMDLSQDFVLVVQRIVNGRIVNYPNHPRRGMLTMGWHESSILYYQKQVIVKFTNQLQVSVLLSENADIGINYTECKTKRQAREYKEVKKVEPKEDSDTNPAKKAKVENPTSQLDTTKIN